MTQLWRIHIRPGEGRTDPVLSYGLCLDRRVIGVGWQVDKDAITPLSIEDYFKLGAVIYGEEWNSGKIAVGLLAKMELDDLVWMRSLQGVYHLCKVTGPWEYRDSAEYRDADVVNVRSVEIIEVGVSTHVPGKVIACFRPARTIQRIMDQTALTSSQRIWAKLTGQVVAPLSDSADLFSLISSEDCEDLIFEWVPHERECVCLWLARELTIHVGVSVDMIDHCLDMSPKLLSGLLTKHMHAFSTNISQISSRSSSRKTNRPLRPPHRLL
jgi:hypothetical protein